MAQNKLLLKAIKSTVAIYDAVTLPAYAIAQRPWIRSQPKVFGRFTKTGDPTSSLVNTWSPPATHPLIKCRTLNEMIRITLEKHADKPGLGYRKLLDSKMVTLEDDKVIMRKNLANELTWITYGEANDRMDRFARGLRELDIKPGHNVAILLDTRPEYLIAAHGILRAGATVGTIYPTLGKEGLKHAINELGAEVIVTSNDLAATLLSFSSELPALKHLIIADTELTIHSTTGPKLVSMADVEQTGRNVHRSLDYVSKPDDLAVIIYTSGSSGVPKGAMIQQGQFPACFGYMDGFFQQFKYTNEDAYLAYLPSSHVFEFFTEVLVMCYGMRIGFGSPLTLATGSPGLSEGCEGDAVLVKPKGIAIVPLMMDKIKVAVQDKVRREGQFKADLFNYAVEYKSKWVDKGYQTPICDALVFKKPRSALGGKLRQVIVGAAPMSEDTQRFMKTVFGFSLLQGFATTETLATGTCMLPQDMSYGRVGTPIHGMQFRLRPWAEGGYTPFDKPNPRGELLMGGENVCVGYYKRPEETKDTIIPDEENPKLRWFATGDIGEVFPDGTIKIIDRKKDMIKLANGKFVSLGKIESVLITSPFIENICLHADSKHNFIVALILPNRIELRKLFKDPPKNFKDICEHPNAIDAVNKSINEISRKSGLGSKEIPAKIKLCDLEWTPQTGLVTATMKVRRKQIHEFYRSELDQMYK